jgi:hypothetical protein
MSADPAMSDHRQKPHSELLMSNLSAFPPAAIPNGTAFIWWGVQVTILTSRNNCFTDSPASLAEYHPNLFCVAWLPNARSPDCFRKSGLLYSEP